MFFKNNIQSHYQNIQSLDKRLKSNREMEPNPVFKKMYQKSFILKKEHDLQVPMVPKQPTLKHQAVTTLCLSTAVHMLIYPLDTIKTRIISRNIVQDVARFKANHVSKMTLYLGILRGYGSLMIGNMCHLTIGRESIALAALVEGLLKTWIDMSKISKQMANEKGDLSIMKKSFGICAVYGAIRDVLFRTTYVSLSSYLHKTYLSNPKTYDERIRINIIFLSVIVSTLISQPFEVLFVKAASQRIFHYNKILQMPAQIMRQQRVSKLLVGGLWPRLLYNVLSTVILVNAFDPLLKVSLQVF